LTLSVDATSFFGSKAGGSGVIGRRSSRHLPPPTPRTRPRREAQVSRGLGTLAEHGIVTFDTDDRAKRNPS
jgi:hypothetical protein